MSCRSRVFFVVACCAFSTSLTSIAVAASVPAVASNAHNLILFIPEALPANGIELNNAPTLARLRHDGVSFVNSHSGFPRLDADDSIAGTSDLNAEALVAAAARQYATAFINDTRTSGEEPPPGLHALLTATLPQFSQAKRPFFLVYRLAEPEPITPSGDATRPAFKPDPRAAERALEAARGPDFQVGLVSHAPASNADIARTVAELLQLETDRTGAPSARLLTESFAGTQHRSVPQAQRRILRSSRSIEDLVTEVQLQMLGAAAYFDAAVPTHDYRLAQADDEPWWHILLRWLRPKSVTISISDDDD